MSASGELSRLNASFEAWRWSGESEEQTSKAVSEIISRHARLDVLVNNAGLNKDSLAVRMTEDNFRRVIDVNLVAVFNWSKSAAKVMMKQRSGRIVNLTSIVAFTGNPGQVNYSASKAGVVALTKTMALELASRSVTVNAVAPGFIDTDMTRAMDEKVREALLAKVPMGVIGQGSDVAEAVAFLVSPAASYITGQTIHVNGGMYM
jgi:3-oxoacyl-[acyl-carrier protein] reductase